MDIRVSGHQLATGAALQEHAADRLNAIRFLVEYSYGKPSQLLEHGGVAGQAIRVTLDLGDHDRD
jgi:hypothetical protein